MARCVPSTRLPVVLTAAAVLMTACAFQAQRGIPPVAGIGEPSGAVTRDGDRQVVLRVFDAKGNRLDWSAFRRNADNGLSASGLDDALLDATTLMMTRSGPLFSSNGAPDGDPAVTLPAHGASALSLAWPTKVGYSNLVFDLPNRGGTYDFNELAATQALDDIAASLSARPWYQPGATFSELYARAKRDYSRGERAKNEAQGGALFAQSLDAGVSAEMLLVTEAGVDYAASHANSDEWGATFDTITGGIADLKTAASLYPKDGWLRICFDPGEKPEYYTVEIARAHELGLRIVGQILDSSEMRHWSVAAFERRTREYVDALPEVDEWETGNEVNGNWLGSIQSVVAKTRYASKYVKDHTRARVLVTLYWELGDGSLANAIFNWARANMGSIVPYVDDVGISLYPRQNPMGEPFDRVVRLLHAAFPQQRIMITELDYDHGKGWWWGSPDSIVPQGRDAVARTYQSAIMGYRYSGGGTFWWYFVEEVSRRNALYRTLKSVYRSAQPS
jgi:hypothetical protein